jgi:hypothetical protein
MKAGGASKMGHNTVLSHVTHPETDESQETDCFSPGLLFANLLIRALAVL